MNRELLVEVLKIAKTSDSGAQVEHLVRLSMALHNLNKKTEAQLGMSMVQYHLLRTLRDMPACSPQMLAQAAGMHPSTLTQSMKRLLKRKQIHIGEDPRDSRKKVLSLTYQGRDAIQGFEAGITSILQFESSPREGNVSSTSRRSAGA